MEFDWNEAGEKFNRYLSLSKSGDEAYNNNKIEFFNEEEWDIVDPLYASLYWNEGGN